MSDMRTEDRWDQRQQQAARCFHFVIGFALGARRGGSASWTYRAFVRGGTAFLERRIESPFGPGDWEPFAYWELGDFE